MQGDVAVSVHVERMSEYVLSAELNLGHDNLTPALDHALQALTCGFRAALHPDAGDGLPVHEVARRFARRHGHRVDAGSLKRLEAGIRPWARAGSADVHGRPASEVDAEVRFVLRFIESTLLDLLDD